jgi:DNA modification methylase
MPELGVVYTMAATDFLALLPDEAVHLQVFDPPYGIGYEAGWQTTNGHLPRVAATRFVTDDVFDASFLPDAYRVLRDGGACYLFTQWTVMQQWREALEAAGYTVQQLIIWDKLNWGGGNLQAYGNQTELILFATKGRHRLRYPRRQGNVWRMTKLDTINYEGNYDNPTQKPQRLIRKAILNSSDVGDIVLDVHCGSGTTPAAAQETGRRWYACDIDPRQVAIAQARLALPHKLPMLFIEEQ